MIKKDQNSIIKFFSEFQNLNFIKKQMQFEQSTYRPTRASLFPFIRNDLTTDEPDIPLQNQQKSEIKIKRYLLERYHDESYIVKQKQLNNLQKYAKFLRNVTKQFRRLTGQRTQYQIGEQEQNQILTLHPQSTKLYIWNLLVASSIIFHFFQIPISLFFTQLVFNQEFSSPAGIICNVISLIILFFNMIYVIPNTQYYHHGFLVANPQKIIYRYLGWRLFIDVLSYFFLFIYVVSKTYALIYPKTIFYLMIYRLGKIDYALQRKIELTKIRLAVYKLIRIIALLLFLVLWLASIFFAIDYHFYKQGADATYTGTYLWLTYSSATNDVDIIQTYPDQWIIWLDYAVYWCIQTVTMVGFGDVTGKNPLQVTLTSVVITCIVILYAFFITGVWQIISQATQFSDYQNKQWLIYKQYIRYHMKPLDLQNEQMQKGIRYREIKNKVGSYLFEMWSNQKNYSQANIAEILQKSLPSELKDEVFINYRQHLFQRIHLFGQLQRLETKNYQYIFRELIFKITQKKYAHQQKVIQAGKINQNLIYLVNGVLSIQYPNSNYRRKFLHSYEKLKDINIIYDEDENYNFGVKQFFTQQRMPYSVISLSFSRTSELLYSDFIKSIKSIQSFYNRFCELRDNLKFLNMDQLTGQQCIQCHSPGHDLEGCQQSDLTMCYKKHWLKINVLTKLKLKAPQNKDKCSKIQFKRKDRKSLKQIELKPYRTKQISIDQIKNYNSYFPFHNL